MLIKKQVLIASLVVFLSFAAGTATAAPKLTSSETSLLRAVNATRTAHGLRPLRVDAALERAARAYSKRLLVTNTFSHGAFSSRIVSYGVRGPVIGENLAWGVGAQAQANAIVAEWLASPAHRRNLLRPGFRRIGIGAASGRFLGNDGATVVAADFAGY